MNVQTRAAIMETSTSSGLGPLQLEARSAFQTSRAMSGSGGGVMKALHDDEYEELKESKLGVFIKFQELGFDWASRLVHYMLGFQLDIKKKYELWSLVGPEPVRFSLLEFEHLTGLNCEYIEDLERPHSVVTKELTSFWEMLGVHVEAGPSTQEIIAALERCEGWSRDDRKRLAYLAIFTGYIEGRKYSTPTRVSLARLVMELERFENYPRGRVAFKVLMISVKGRDISGCYTINGFAQALQFWTRVINFVQKDIGEMFPKWEFDVEWTMDCWEITGTWVNTKPAVVSPAKKKVVKEDSPRPQKKARKEASEEAAAVASKEAAAEASEEVHTTVGGLTKEDIKTMFKDIVDAMREGFGMFLKEIKYLSERVEAVEKKSESVNGTNAGRKSLPEDKGPDQSPYTANSTAKVIIPNKKLYPGYNPFAPIDKKKLKELADWLKTCPRTLVKCFQNGSLMLRTRPAENIIKLMFVKKQWKWTMDYWKVTGTWVNTNPAVVSPAKKKVVKEDSPRPRKKARKEASEEASEEASALASEEAAAEASEEVHTTIGGLTKEDIKTKFKDIVDAMREGFGTCLKEIKYLSERVEAVEKKVGITTKWKGTSAQNTTPPPKPTLEPRQSPDTANSTAKVIIPNKKLYPGYNPFAPIDKKKLKELADCHYRTPLDKKPRTSRTWWYQILRTSLEWLEDCSLVVFEVVFLVVGLPSILPSRLGFQDMVFAFVAACVSVTLPFAMFATPGLDSVLLRIC
ncbi:hypothetical protein F2Q68_00046142 [Brassica cretica]|uniref:DUF1985 domain-containing protein n=1 Tax=Brassica cretica TaxID=69181 RepID=A0A8S9LTC8_BRACR|nr:hypothetical protein F2Q68_00046142 [Brassica cretica]